MKFSTVLLILCTLFWLASAVMGIIFPDHDWRISFIIASATLSAMMGILAVSDIRNARKEKNDG